MDELANVFLSIVFVANNDLMNHITMQDKPYQLAIPTEECMSWKITLAI